MPLKFEDRDTNPELHQQVVCEDNVSENGPFNRVIL